MPEVGNQVGPPRLLDFSCNVQESGSGSSVCQLVLKLEKNHSSSSCVNEERDTAVVLELEAGTVATLLDGLGRVRDQLSSVTNKKLAK